MGRGGGGYDLKKKFGFRFVQRQKSEIGTRKKNFVGNICKKKKEKCEKNHLLRGNEKEKISENENFSHKKWI